MFPTLRTLQSQQYVSTYKKYKLYCTQIFKNSWKEVVDAGILTPLGEAGNQNVAEVF